MNTTPEKIRRVMSRLEALLIEKNARYGDSALDPVRLFSNANAIEQLLVRIDDKLSRIAHGNGAEDEDALLDLAGYIVLLIIAKNRKGGF